MAVGNIYGSVQTTASLDSLVGSTNQAPQGGTVVKASALTVNAGSLTGNQYADISGNNGCYGASASLTANWSLSGTGSNTGSYNIAACSGTPHNFSGNEVCALQWVAGGNTYTVADATITAANVGNNTFTLNAPAGQATLPANGTTIILATNTDVVLSLPAAANVQQVLATTTTLAAIEFFNATTLRAPGLVLMSPSSVPAATASYTLVNTGSLVVNAAATSGFYSNVGNPFNTGQLYTKARVYNFNATTNAVVGVAVLIT